MKNHGLSGSTRQERHGSERTIYCPELISGRRAGDHLKIAPDQAKHYERVLRFKAGNTVRVVNGGNLWARASFQGGGKNLTLELISEVFEDSHVSPFGNIQVILGLPRNAVADSVVEKLAEMGVGSLRFVTMERSVVRPRSEEGQKYEDRWAGIAISALEQSEQTRLLEVGAPLSWQDALLAMQKEQSGEVLSPHGAISSRFVFCSESRMEGSWYQAALDLAQAQRSGLPLVLWFGPEGGFSLAEREALAKLGFRELSLGPSILRVETAVVVGCALAASHRSG